MEKTILSLKSIYMLLMNDDFPIYSESVISKADRKGQTLLRFWQRVLAEEFRSLPCGKMIWRDDDRRNRNPSYLCNRSAELRCYQDYAKEIASQVSTVSLLEQISRFMTFLSGKKYDHGLLLRRVRELVRLAQAQDTCVSGEIARQIEAAAEPALQEAGRRGELFQAGYLLTLLTLYGASGEAMAGAPMAVLRGRGYGLEELWQAYGEKHADDTGVTFLTVHSSMLQDNLLPWDRFFGREEELYDLCEMAAAGRKCAVCGMGGIGKTELLRQLLRRCQEEGIADQIAVVPYISNLVESFARAFPGFRRQEPEEELHKVLYQIGKAAEQGRRILLLIDNVDRSVEEDSGLAWLHALPCGVLITTRQRGMEGFEAYQVQPPDASAGMLIFRDNYGRPLTEGDRAALEDMLSDEGMRHPVTLRLMARAARSRGWSVEGLRGQLKKNGVSLSWQEGDRTVRLGQMYRQLYSYMDIPKECQALVELFTLLPRASYAASFLREAFPEVVGGAPLEPDGGVPVESAEGGSLEQELGVLVAGGWLEDDGSGYSMHPFIAQCLRRKVLTEERLEPVLETLRDWLLRAEAAGRPEDFSEESQRRYRIFVSICQLLSGGVSRELMVAALTAVYGVVSDRQEAEEYKRCLEQLMKRCSEKDDWTEVYLCVVLAHMGLGDTAQFVSVYQRQKERLSVPVPLFLDFCIYAGQFLGFEREYDLGEQILQEGLCDAANPFQKATAYYHLGILYELQGNWEAGLQWNQASVEYVTTHPECGEYLTLLNLCMCCGSYVKYGQKEAAEVLLGKIQGLLREDSLYVLKSSYEDIAGMYELTFGSLEQALFHYARSLEQRLQYKGKNIEYYGVLGQLVIVLQRLKRYEEAIAAYGELLDYARESSNVFMLQRFSNNLAVLYLDMGKPEEALAHLQTAREEGKKLGDIPLGEALRNTARAYGQLGDLTREYQYYQEAAPLLDAGYGPDHPRTVETKARLAELEKER